MTPRKDILWSEQKRLLRDLDPIGSEALRLFRLWVWGSTHRDTLRLALKVQMGPKNARCAVSALEYMDHVLGTVAPNAFDIAPPDTCAVTADEARLIAIVAAAVSGADTSQYIASLPLQNDGHNALISAMTALGQVVESKVSNAPTACPMACPSRASCPERAKLRLVE